jgi:hypothetical protein
VILEHQAALLSQPALAHTTVRVLYPLGQFMARLQDPGLTVQVRDAVQTRKQNKRTAGEVMAGRM